MEKEFFAHSNAVDDTSSGPSVITVTERFQKLTERLRRDRERFLNLSLSFSTEKASKTAPSA